MVVRRGCTVFFFLDVIQLLSPVCTYFTLLALRQKSHAVLIDEIAVSDSGKSIRRDLKRLEIKLFHSSSCSMNRQNDETLFFVQTAGLKGLN